jgi:hypothetical protein
MRAATVLQHSDSMADERLDVTMRGLGRWAVVALVILAGIGLYFAAGRQTPPVIQTPAGEVAP